ncbi:hypothetical protein L208DRAFT_1403092, partial [Tricholoma matsutake]
MTPLSRISSEGGVGVAFPLLAIHHRCPLLIIHHCCCPLFVPHSLSSCHHCSQFVVAPLSTPQAEARGGRQRH